DLFKHLKLVSSTPIRNMATLAGNFVNASPIGDMTVWFLALDAEIVLSEPPATADGSSETNKNPISKNRTIPLKDLYLGYKQLAKSEDELITGIRFRKGFTHFNFEKVCKRTFLDIASVNAAVSLRLEPADDFSQPSALTASAPPALRPKILEAHAAIGGVAPVPLYLRKTSEFLAGKEISAETILEANEILQTEIGPISDVRGSKEYKRLLARQLFTAHFVELFDFQPGL
ncbi:MAG: FAD binding domain-containing protein, partial [Pyrinomonadaceae bacterium]